jgi:hypothetical protein
VSSSLFPFFTFITLPATCTHAFFPFPLPTHPLFPPLLLLAILCPRTPPLPPSNTLFRLRIVLGLPICILSSLLYNKNYIGDCINKVYLHTTLYTFTCIRA